MSERVEIPIEGGDFDYDEDQIQELDHFDIGEEEDPEEVTAREAGVWEDAIQRVPLSRQPRKHVPKKPGRKRQGEVIHIPKRQPPRGCAQRVKSYQQYDTFGDDEDEEGDEEEEDMVEQHDIQEEMVMVEGVEEEDSDPEPLDEDGEPSTSKMFRVFVRKDGSGMHYDWPIYQDSVISLKDVVHIISSEAQGIQKSLICTTIPEEFTNNGTFIIHFEEEESLGKEAICNDGLGTWNSAQMFVRKYIVAEGWGGRPMMTQKNDHNLKIVCEQFLHPGTDTRGDFIRKIYTGFDKDEHLIPYVVISYEWMGQPHPLTVYEDDTEKQQPFEQMTWKKCSRPDDQVPILARHGCDYNSAVAILLSAEKCTSYGKSVPQYVQECISFVLDVDECGGHRALFMDGNEWQRPSGSHRFFRISYAGGGQNSGGDLNNGGGVGSSSSSGGGGGGGAQWSIERCPANFSAANSDIQVLCRRYNGQKYSSSVGFVRKIYQLKILPTCPMDIAAQLVNQNLAIVSYSYRNSAMPTYIEQPSEGGKLANGELVGEEVEVVNGEVIFDEVLGPEMRQMVEAVEVKKKTNEQRLIGILQRIHRLDDVCKKEHWPDAATEVQQLMEISALLEGYIN